MSGGSSGSFRGEPARRSGLWVALVLGALVIVNLYVFVWDKKTSVGAVRKIADSRSAVIPGAALDPNAGSAAPSPVPVPSPSPAPAPIAAVAAPVGPPGTIDGKVGKGDSLGRVLKHSGLSGAEADEVIRALAGTLDFKAIRAGQTFRIERGADGRVKLFELVISKVQRVRAERDATGALVGKSDQTQTRIEVQQLGGRIDSSLYAALKSAGASTSLGELFIDVFAYDLDFYNDTHDGDTFRVIVEAEVQDKGATKELVKYRRVLAAEYQGKAGTFRTFLWGGGNPDLAKARYFDEQGQSSDKMFLKTPLKFTRVSSGFDRKRMHPVLHTLRAHLGIDYAAPVGTPVWAAAAGTIITRAPAGGAGNLVMIRHDGGIDTAYMHLSKFADGQQVGEHVAAKTVIGYVGATGLATGPHLHFGVRKDGEYIDPTKLAPLRGKGVPADQLDAFHAEAGKLAAMLATIAIPAATTASVP